MSSPPRHLHRAPKNTALLQMESKKSLFLPTENIFHQFFTMKRIIECVPNFSEGRNMKTVDLIAGSISDVAGVKVLNIDPGAAANRTVITFAGVPEAVSEAAFRSVKCAAEHIDMRKHRGEHPRTGATDVLPLVPVSGITLEECAALARKLAERIYNELGIPCYCYEAAAFKPARKNLAVCRAGEYESLAEKINDPDRRPDFSPESFTETAAAAGATVVGARDFLIAVNFNLNTDSAALAHEIACDVRERGRSAERPGKLKGCKAIGWYIEEYGIAQVSMNITDINASPLHVAYTEVCSAAESMGLKVTGTEIIGLVPEKTLLDAGQYFMTREGTARDAAAGKDLVDIAIKSMGLDDLRPFDPDSKIIERLLH